MHRGYGGKPVDPVKGWEYNVWADIPSSQATFAAPWLSMTLTPLTYKVSKRYLIICAPNIE